MGSRWWLKNHTDVAPDTRNYHPVPLLASAEVRSIELSDKHCVGTWHTALLQSACVLGMSFSFAAGHLRMPQMRHYPTEIVSEGWAC